MGNPNKNPRKENQTKNKNYYFQQIREIQIKNAGNPNKKSVKTKQKTFN
jgi:hypothetical protein